MLVRQRIDEVTKALSESHSASDWRQRIQHPEEREAGGWGSPEVLAENRTTKKFERVCRVYDSDNLRLVLSMRTHVESIFNDVAVEIRRSWMTIIGCDKPEIDEACSKASDLNLADELEELAAAIRISR